MQNLEGKSFLPVTEKAVNQALMEISFDPDAAIILEAGIIERQNPELNLTLNMRLQDVTNSKTYIEGALFTHAILRWQANLNGTSLPRVTAPVATQYERDRIRDIQRTDVNMSIEEEWEILKNRMFKQEPNLQRAVEELTKYRPGRIDFFGASAEVYLLLKATQETQDLRRKLS